jgi:hypothetical protein
LATFVWVELVDPVVLVVGWVAVGSIWFVSGMMSGRERRRVHAASEQVSAEDLFRQAQGEYLRGHWYETETVLTHLLEHHPRDVEARLLLATLLRRTKRQREALQQLAQLERLEGHEKWRPEIEAQRRLTAGAEPSLESLLSEKLAAAPLSIARAA